MTILHSHHDKRWIILGIMSLSLVIVMLNNVTLNVALPNLALDLKLKSNSEMQWIVDAYALIFGGTLLVTMTMRVDTLQADCISEVFRYISLVRTG